MTNTSATFPDSKQHFLILDALRGVASIVVVLFHIMEVYSGSDHVKQVINHGYLAVDFFFMLSGYVMAHAYDDRWDRMTVKDFFKRRIIRLHPMIIFGMTLGALCFYFGQSDPFPKIAETSIGQLIVILLIGYTLIPVPPSMDIRGWNEMHPLNGPAWSLFLEYIANILHALVLRRLSKLMLSFLVVIAAMALIQYAVTSPGGDIIGGWSIEPEQLRIGFTRLLFPYMAGMLLRRVVNIAGDKNTFFFCSLLLVFFLSFPRVGGYENLWANGLFDALTVILVFPVIIYLGANGVVKNKGTEQFCVFLGNISYPLYMIHFPLVYLMYAWVATNNVPIENGFMVGLLILAVSVGLSYGALKLYDEPFRKWLTKRFIKPVR